LILPITVLMSVYNGERWLAESITSVLNQTHIDFEFIIVNDGSVDSTLKIIERFASIDRRIKIIDKPNTGLADSLNQGILQARGEWIARIDADDLCAPNRLTIQYELAQSCSTLVLIGSNLIEIDVLGQDVKTFRYPNYHHQLVSNLIQKKRFFAHSSAFIRTKSLKLIGGYRTRIKRAQDYDLWLRLSEIGEIACIDASLVSIRHHAGQVTHEEGGRRQVVDSRVALVSHLLRHKGAVDPVGANSTDKDFANFRSFIEREIELDGIIEYRLFIMKIREELSKHNLVRVIELIALCGSPLNFIIRYVKEAAFGEKLGQRLANDWIRKGSTCAE